MEKSWSEQKSENARLQAKRQAERAAFESAKASEYLQRFVQEAKHDGLPDEPLVVLGFGGKGRAKTGLRGWYLKADHTMAVSTDGDFYLLIGDLSWKDRIRGYKPQPSSPPLVLGAGGRDGESIDLKDALTKLLPSWRSGKDNHEGNGE